MYWSHFGLERQPFRPAIDLDSYFPTPSHEEAIAALAAGFARRDSFISIDGKTGVGKSLVARKWLEHLLAEVPRVLIPNSRAAQPGELLQAILFDLGKPYLGLSEQELRLNVTGHLLDVAAESTYPITLILDEAQHLSPQSLEELRLLCNLETRQGSAVFIVLISQPSLRDVFGKPGCESIAQRVAVQVTVQPLTLKESADYLKHQLRAAGGDASKLFDDSAVPLLAAGCNGIPRLLNRAAAVSMELSASAKAEQVDVEAALEALDRLGLNAIEPTGETGQVEEAVGAVILPHPARTVEPSRSRRGKSVDGADEDEDANSRGPKERASRKRTV